MDLLCFPFMYHQPPLLRQNTSKVNEVINQLGGKCYQHLFFTCSPVAKPSRASLTMVNAEITSVFIKLGECPEMISEYDLSILEYYILHLYCQSKKVTNSLVAE